MSLRRVFLAMVLVGMLALAACGGGSSNAQNVTVKMGDYKFEPNTITVKANSPVNLTVDNSGTVKHDLTVQGMAEKVQVTADPGQKKSVDFTPSKAGTYKIICAQPGHSDLGMVGQLVVQ